MKKIIFSKMVIALVAVMMLSSCRDLFNVPDIQKNPNAPLDAPIDPLLSGTLVGLATVHEDTDTRIAYMWGGQLAGLSRQQAGFQVYIVASTTFDNSWSILYNAAANARLIQTKAAPFNNKVALGIGQVIECMLMAKLTALYGDVPYSQAFDVEKFPKPIFDKQVDVYASLIATLDKAYANLNSALGSVDGSFEFLYGGDNAKWAEAAKTLQARLYLHLKDYPKAIAAAKLGISSTDNDMLVPHGGSQQVDLNLNFDMFENSRPGDTGFDSPAFLPDFMKTRLDGQPQPLVPIVTKGAKKDTIRSSTARVVKATKRQTAATRNDKTDETALYNHFFGFDIYSAGALDPNTIDGVFTSDAPHPLLTYYETQLILAEAYARTGATATAIDNLNNVRDGLAGGYINGKTISDDYQALGIQYDQYDATDFAPGGTANPTGKTDQVALLYEIISQRFIVLLAQYEVFNDLRRLQVATPKVTLPIPVTGPVAKGYPARYIYSQTEINTNPNVPKGSSGGVADIYQKLPIFQ